MSSTESDRLIEEDGEAASRPYFPKVHNFLALHCEHPKVALFLWAFFLAAAGTLVYLFMGGSGGSSPGVSTTSDPTTSVTPWTRFWNTTTPSVNTTTPSPTQNTTTEATTTTKCIPGGTRIC